MFLKFRIRDSIDFAVVSAASAITMTEGICKQARIILGAVAPVPVRVIAAEEFLKGKAVTEEAARQAAAIAVENVIRLSMHSYKFQIAQKLVEKSIMAVMCHRLIFNNF
jgi:CO/xanthine dehydrogenase FAD-binding subunit